MTGQVIPDEVFIIRFWVESEGKARAQHWRARINVLNAGEEIHADGVEQAVKVIRSVLRNAGMKRE